MAYTVKQVATMSGVSVRALHFYDETGLLKPAYHGANGYRFYEEPQLLMLQQVLFYRELGFELKKIKQILGRPNFEKLAALQSHRKVLQQNLGRARRLIETIDKTIEHLKGTRTMNKEEIFAGFTVAAGNDRFGAPTQLGEQHVDCKLSAKDTNGALYIFEFNGGWPRHLHREQDEWIYVVEGEYYFEVGEKRFRLKAGESVFIPRKVPHVLVSAEQQPGRLIYLFQPAGKMEEFFRAANQAKGLPTKEDCLKEAYTADHIAAVHELFGRYGMDVVGPPLLRAPDE